MNKIFKIFFVTLLVFSGLGVVMFLWGWFHILTFTHTKTGSSAYAALVFGAAVNPDNSASDAMKDRVLEGVRLYKRGQVKKIIVSGAPSVYGKHEADLMASLAESFGVKKEDIIIDKFGMNTCNSIKNLDKSKSYIMVSNGYHLARIDYLSRYFSVKHKLQSSKYLYGVYAKRTFFVLREIIAYWYYLLFFDGNCDSSNFRFLNPYYDKTTTKILKIIK